MVALLSQCFNDENITKSEKFDSDELTLKKTDDQKKIDTKSSGYPFPPQKEYPDIPKPDKSQLLKKDESYTKQYDDLSGYVDYLEKLVVDYKNYIDERFNSIDNQKYKVIENFSMGSKNTNDLLLYIMTCVFVLLLIDYIFKMGKSSY